MKRIPTFVFVLILPLISTISAQEIPSLGIVNGEAAAIGSFPFLVSLQYTNRNHFCGANIINTRWIVTAAHCLRRGKLDTVSNSGIIVVAGSNFLDQPGQTYNVIQRIVHKQFNTDYRNDIALLQVDRDIEFTDTVSPIELSSESVPPGARVTAAGWGVATDGGRVPTNDLQFVNMDAINLATCSSRIPEVEIFENNICTQPIVGQGTCAGDSGGPLVYNNELVGILSWGQKCGGTSPEVYTKVADFRRWINDRVSQ